MSGVKKHQRSVYELTFLSIRLYTAQTIVTSKKRVFSVVINIQSEIVHKTLSHQIHKLIKSQNRNIEKKSSYMLKLKLKSIWINIKLNLLVI